MIAKQNMYISVFFRPGRGNYSHLTVLQSAVNDEKNESHLLSIPKRNVSRFEPVSRFNNAVVLSDFIHRGPHKFTGRIRRDARVTIPKALYPAPCIP